MGGLTPRLNAILNKLEQFGELTARKLQSAISWLRKEKPDKIRQDLIELAKLGYGKLVGTGNRLKLLLSVDRDVDRLVDRPIDPETQDSSGIEPPNKPSVDRSIVGDSQLHVRAPSVQGVVNRESRGLQAPELGSGDSPLGVGKNSLEDRFQANSTSNELEILNRSEINNEQNSKNGNNDRPIDSYDLNRELVGHSAINNRSTSTSTVATVSQTAKATEFSNSHATNSDCIVTEIASRQEQRQSSEIVNKRGNFSSLVLGMKVFTHLVSKALSVSEDAVEPDLVTPIVEYRGYETLARLLLRCETPEALAVLRSIFPPTLLFESLTCLANSQEHLQRLKNLEIENHTNGNDLNSVETDSEILSHQPIYVYWGESKIGEELENSARNLKCEQYLDKGTLVVALHGSEPNGSSQYTNELEENTATMSSDNLAFVQILGRPNSCYPVKHHDLIQLC